MTNIKYTVWDYEKRKIIEYERHGECNQCGDCCAVRVYIQISKNSNTVAVIGEEDRHDYGIHQPHPTTQLCEGYQDNVCLKQGNGKPAQCINWPWAPDCLTHFSRCSYTFVETRSWDMETDDESVT